jgi:penicillin-binding protein 1A
LRRGMGKSVNSIAAQIIEKIGWTTVIDYAHRLGIKSRLDTVPSVGLGSSDVSVYELVSAYCTFMNHGIYTEPSFITKIVDRNGKVLHVFNATTKRAISEETAYLMTYMLKGGLEEPGGTSQALFAYDLFRGNELGGKTGTSSHHSDGWFVGVTKDIVAGMWVGGDDRCIHFKTSAVGEGSKTALPMFGLFMEKVYKDKSLDIKMGAFPKPTVPISKPYNCRTVLPKDSSKTKSDSLKALDEIEF